MARLEWVLWVMFLAGGMTLVSLLLVRGATTELRYWRLWYARRQVQRIREKILSGELSLREGERYH